MNKVLFNFDEYGTMLVVGNPHQGKSTFLEWYFEFLIKNGFIPIDAYGSPDLECLSWVLGNKSYKMLVIKPNYLDVKIKKEFEKRISFVDHTESLKNIIESAKKEKRIIVIATGLWIRNDKIDLNLMTFLSSFFYKLIKYNIKRFDKIAIMQRDAGDLYSPRFKLFGDYTKKIETASSHLFRQVGHARTRLIIDNQRYMGMVSDMRDLIDLIIIKKTNRKNFPSALSFVEEGIIAKRIKYAHSMQASKPFKDELENRYKKVLSQHEIKKLSFSDASLKYPLPWELKKNQYIAVFGDDTFIHGLNGMPSFQHHNRYGAQSMWQKLGLEVDDNNKEDPYSVKEDDNKLRIAIATLIISLQKATGHSQTYIVENILEDMIPRRTISDWVRKTKKELE